MIPKKIHYCWFGGNKKPNSFNKYLKTWKKILPDYEILEWNENNYKTNHVFFNEMYKRKKWAFVSDYARLDILNKEGGIYLDVDMEVVKSFNDLLKFNCFLGYEDKNLINGAIIGVSKDNVFIKSCLEEYNNIKNYDLINSFTIPQIITKHLKKNGLEKYGEQEINGIKIYTEEYFYPYKKIDGFSKKCITNNTYAIHHWNDSWGDKNIIKIISIKLTIFTKKIGIYNFLKKIYK
ncbi:MAG: glycosyltransferase [Candidatus Gracilibacteria bacterium]|nr:glycosyltransferase [Candidatus Gracilibacteria bacterium]